MVPRLGAAVVVGARAEAVGDAASAEGDAAVGRALRVAVGVRQVAEQLAAAPADPVPLRVGSGSVTTIDEFIGSSARRWPASPAVKPSRQRSTYGARTVPCGVTARPGSIAVTRVCSWIVTPSPRTTPARPRTRSRGLHAGAVGVEVAAEGAGDVDPLGASRGRSARRTGASGGMLPHPGELGGGARDVQDAAPEDVGLDVLLVADRDHLVDGAAQRRGEPVDAGGAVGTAGIGASGCRASPRRASRRCGPRRRSRRTPPRGPRSAAPGRPSPGSTRPTAR